MTYFYTLMNFSSKRDELFRTYQDFTEVPHHKVLKHGSTRWLSLEKCVDRTLEQWPALTSYFLSEADNNKAQKIQERLLDHEMKLYFMFLHVQLPIFNKFNLLFQVRSRFLSTKSFAQNMQHQIKQDQFSKLHNKA